MSNPFRKQWQSNAEAFTQLINGKGTPHHQKILNPCIEQLMGNVEGRRILDAGCGEGYLSRYYAQKGAEVIAVDFSSELIEIGKRYSKELPITFLIGDLCSLETLHDEDFDIILCNLVLLNLDCLEKSLQEFHRLLRPKGFVVFSIVHPAFNIYGPGHWEVGVKDSESGRRKGKFFVMDQYFLEKEYRFRWKTRSGEGFPEEFSFFHRTIATYIKTLLRIGFRLTGFEEPRPIINAPFFERERRIPFFLVIRAEKD